MREQEINRELVKTLRIENNMTVIEFCRECGISKDTYYKIMNYGKCGVMSTLKIAMRMNVRLNKIYSPFNETD